MPCFATGDLSGCDHMQRPQVFGGVAEDARCHACGILSLTLLSFLAPLMPMMYSPSDNVLASC